MCLFRLLTLFLSTEKCLYHSPLSSTCPATHHSPQAPSALLPLPAGLLLPHVCVYTLFLWPPPARGCPAWLQQKWPLVSPPPPRLPSLHSTTVWPCGAACSHWEPETPGDGSGLPGAAAWRRERRRCGGWWLREYNCVLALKHLQERRQVTDDHFYNYINYYMRCAAGLQVTIYSWYIHDVSTYCLVKKCSLQGCFLGCILYHLSWAECHRTGCTAAVSAAQRGGGLQTPAFGSATSLHPLHRRKTEKSRVRVKKYMCILKNNINKTAVSVIWTLHLAILQTK